MLESMTLVQVTGYLHAPKRDMKRLALTAKRALERVAELEAEKRRLEEQVAAHDLDRSPIVVVLHRSGYVEVRAAAYANVKVVHRPDLGGDREGDADEWVASRLPLSHRLLLDPMGSSKLIAAGNTTGCMDRYSYRCLQEDLAAVKALRELEKNATSVEEATKVSGFGQG